MANAAGALQCALSERPSDSRADERKGRRAGISRAGPVASASRAMRARWPGRASHVLVAPVAARVPSSMPARGEAIAVL
jgi:hypothetical protein